jgi:hypothetical protein
MPGVRMTEPLSSTLRVPTWTFMPGEVSVGT